MRAALSTLLSPWHALRRQRTLRKVPVNVALLHAPSPTQLMSHILPAGQWQLAVHTLSAAAASNTAVAAAALVIRANDASNNPTALLFTAVPSPADTASARKWLIITLWVHPRSGFCKVTASLLVSASSCHICLIYHWCAMIRVCCDSQLDVNRMYALCRYLHLGCIKYLCGLELV